MGIKKVQLMLVCSKNGSVANSVFEGKNGECLCVS